MGGRKRNLAIGIISLFIGTVCYVLFREGSHIGKWFEFVPQLNVLREWVKPFSNEITRGYVQDFSWCLSLACGLHIVLHPAGKQIFLCGMMASCCGAIWELLQHLSWVKGTADFWDIVVYFAAGNVYIITNIKESLL